MFFQKGRRESFHQDLPPRNGRIVVASDAQILEILEVAMISTYNALNPRPGFLGPARIYFKK